MLHALRKINHSMYIIGGKEENDIQETLDSYVFYNPLRIGKKKERV